MSIGFPASAAPPATSVLTSSTAAPQQGSSSSRAPAMMDLLQKRLHVEVTKLESITSQLTILKNNAPHGGVGGGGPIEASRQRTITTLEAEMDRQMATVEGLVKETQQAALSEGGAACRTAAKQQHHIAHPTASSRRSTSRDRWATTADAPAPRAVSRGPSTKVSTPARTTTRSQQLLMEAKARAAEHRAGLRNGDGSFGAPHRVRAVPASTTSPVKGSQRQEVGQTSRRSPAASVMASAGAMRFGALDKEAGDRRSPSADRPAIPTYAQLNPGDPIPVVHYRGESASVERSPNSGARRDVMAGHTVTQHGDSAANHRATPSFFSYGDIMRRAEEWGRQSPQQRSADVTAHVDDSYAEGSSEVTPTLPLHEATPSRQDVSGISLAATPFRVFTVNIEDVLEAEGLPPPAAHPQAAELGVGLGVPEESVPLTQMLPGSLAAMPPVLHVDPPSLAEHLALLRDMVAYQSQLEGLLGKLVILEGRARRQQHDHQHHQEGLSSVPEMGSLGLHKEMKHMLLAELGRVEAMVAGITGEAVDGCEPLMAEDVVLAHVVAPLTFAPSTSTYTTGTNTDPLATRDAQTWVRPRDTTSVGTMPKPTPLGQQAGTQTVASCKVIDAASYVSTATSVCPDLTGRWQAAAGTTMGRRPWEVADMGANTVVGTVAEVGTETLAHAALDAHAQTTPVRMVRTSQLRSEGVGTSPIAVPLPTPVADAATMTATPKKPAVVVVETLPQPAPHTSSDSTPLGLGLSAEEAAAKEAHTAECQALHEEALQYERELMAFYVQVKATLGLGDNGCGGGGGMDDFSPSEAHLYGALQRMLGRELARAQSMCDGTAGGVVTCVNEVSPSATPGARTPVRQ